MLRYICHLRSIPTVSCVLLSHRSQEVQTSRFSVARCLMDTCGMLYKRGFGNVICNCNFVICTIKYTHTYALGTGFELVSLMRQMNNPIMNISARYTKKRIRARNPPFKILSTSVMSNRQQIFSDLGKHFYGGLGWV